MFDTGLEPMTSVVGGRSLDVLVTRDSGNPIRSMGRKSLEVISKSEMMSK